MDREVDAYDLDLRIADVAALVLAVCDTVIRDPLHPLVWVCELLDREHVRGATLADATPQRTSIFSNYPNG